MYTYIYILYIYTYKQIEPVYAYTSNADFHILLHNHILNVSMMALVLLPQWNPLDVP